jgi:energy-coupling factor transport system ATP-binding protein
MPFFNVKMGCSQLMKNLIEFDGVDFSYSLPSGERIDAVRDLTFSIQPGEWVALIGANGSGKTTLVKLVNGLFVPDGGMVRVGGSLTSDRTHQAEIFSKIGLVFQNPRDQIVASLVEEDTAFGPENLCLPRAEINERVDASLAMSGAAYLKKRPTYFLSAGETQRIALAGVLALRPSCLIFDETTSMLDPRSRCDLLELMRKFHAQGFTILHVTHDLDEALLAERVLVLHAGRLVMDGSPQQIFQKDEQLREYGLTLPFLVRFARDLASLFPSIAPFYRSAGELLIDLRKISAAGQTAAEPRREPSSVRSDILIDVTRLAHAYMAGTPLERTALQDVTFSVAEGQSAGLVGQTGSGKSTLLQHLNGLIRPQQGKVRMGDFDLSQKDVDVRALRRQVGLVFQIPEAQFFETYAGDEIAYAARMLGYSGKLRELVQMAMQMVGLDFERFVDRPLRSLSGGQKRRVALASYLVMQPRVLLLDEPFAGLDPLIHQEMIELVRGFHEEGKTIVLSTHTMRDLLQIAQKVIVLNEGKTAFEGSTMHLFHQPLLQTWGLEIPLELSIAEELRKKGWNIPGDKVQWRDMLQWLRANAAEGGHAHL